MQFWKAEILGANYKIFIFRNFFVALSEKECELWVRGLRFLVDDTIAAPYPSQLDIWLRKEFYSMDSSKGK